MLTKLLNFVVGREPVAAATGLAAVVSATLGVAAAFGLGITPEQIAAVGALAAALAGYLSRRVVSPVLTPRGPSEAGGVPLAALLAVLVVVLILGGIATSCDALFEDEDEVDDLGAPALILDHDYPRCMEHDYCGGYDDRDRDGGKQTCFMACYIVVPNPLEGGGREPSEPRTTHP